MTLSRDQEGKLRDALGILVEATPAGADFEELETADLVLVPRRRLSGGFAFAAAFLAVVIVGGLVIWGTLAPDPSNIPLAGSPADPMVLLENPLVVRGTDGPEPRFDTSDLGQEVSLADPVNVADTVGRVAGNLLSPEDEVIRYVITGATESGATAGLVETSSGLHWCLWVVPATETRPTCTGSRSSDTNPVFNFNPLTDGSWQRGTLAWGPLPPDTSVVAITYGDQSYWQRPIGGIALFDIANHGQDQVVLTGYAPDGNIIDTLTGPPIVEDQP